MTLFNTINPATEDTLQSYPLMDKTEVMAILHAMEEARMTWAQQSVLYRKQCLLQLGQQLANRLETLATLITLEMGKPILQSKAEVRKCIMLCEYYAQHAEILLAPETIHTEFYKSYRSFEPLGIIFAIMPWNFPLWQVLRFAIPNLLLGNAALLKHAPNVTGCALAIENLFREAGFLVDIFRSLVIDVDQVPAVIQHPCVAGVTLTGSNRAGMAVATAAASALKKVVLELGGSDPYLILEDADLDLAAEACVQSRLDNAGQVCVAAKRLIVVKAVQAAFEQRVLEKARSYIIGDPLLEGTMMGPMARSDLRLELHRQVEASIQQGARCLLGGTLPTGKGYYYPVTVLTDIHTNNPAFCEELFGPVIAISTAQDTAEAIALANQTIYGLGAAVFTRDVARGEQIARELLHAGTCVVNTMVSSDPRLPFGGIKQSGYGRELSVEGMREFANIKTVIVKAEG